MFSNEKLQFLGETGTALEWLPFAIFFSVIVLGVFATWREIQRDENKKKQGLKNNPQVQSSVFPEQYEKKAA